MKYYDKVTDIGEQFIMGLLATNNVQQRENVTKNQILLILSLQGRIYKKVGDSNWYISKKKKKGGKLDFNKFQKEVFESMHKT